VAKCGHNGMSVASEQTTRLKTVNQSTLPPKPTVEVSINEAAHPLTNITRQRYRKVVAWGKHCPLLSAIFREKEHTHSPTLGTLAGPWLGATVKSSKRLSGLCLVLHVPVSGQCWMHLRHTALDRIRSLHKIVLHVFSSMSPLRVTPYPERSVRSGRAEFRSRSPMFPAAALPSAAARRGPCSRVRMRSSYSAQCSTSAMVERSS
jgi:hypothetical protein